MMLIISKQEGTIYYRIDTNTTQNINEEYDENIVREEIEINYGKGKGERINIKE